MDVTFDLSTERYQPFNKPNDTPTYINVNSNHLPNIIKVLPDNISERINNISFDKAAFNNAAPFYRNVLSASGYKENLIQKDLPCSNKIKQRKIIWFNPPYSVNLEENIRKTFLRLIDKHFSKTNRFHKIFNKNNIRVSCSCLPNFANMIKAHNKRILSEEKTQDQPKWNCKHRNFFKYESKVNSTELSKHFREMKKRHRKINHPLVSYWLSQTIQEQVKKLQLMLNWEVPYFNITHQSH